MENEIITYKKSFYAKLVLAGEETIAVYQQLKDFCSSRKKIHMHFSFEHETIKFGREKIAVMKLSRKYMSLYLALNPKEYEDTKYIFDDAGEINAYQDYPMKMKLKSKRSIKWAMELLAKRMEEVGATAEIEPAKADYKKVFYPRTLERLVQEGYVKKYVKRIVDDQEVIVEESVEQNTVHFTAKLLYCAENAANELLVITNYNDWDFEKAVPMVKVEPNVFEVYMAFPKGTDLEFKICRKDDWYNVEKGIWKEEIVNHHYVVDDDLEVEDLIHNFRQD